MKRRAMPTDPDALLTEDEAAELYGLSPRTFQAWRTENRGPPYVRLGRAIRYRRSALVKHLDENSQDH
jgi:excisionase family DNA binding protein